MDIRESLRQKNRTLLEMHLGILVFGVLCQLVGTFFTPNQLLYIGSLWLGIALACVSVLHMYCTLDKALDLPEKAASRKIVIGYITRYVAFIIVLLAVVLTDMLYPLIVFLGYMSIKAAALTQPLTHRLCNSFFGETDPEAQALPEELEEENKETEIIEREVKL